MAGWAPFAKAMEAQNLFCGFGVEAYQTEGPLSGKPKRVKGQKNDAYHLILLAKTDMGLRNLMRLSDISNRQGFHYHPRINLDLLRAYSEGIIATTACLGSLVCKQMAEESTEALDDLARIFGDRGDLYVELNTYDSPQQVEMNKALAAEAAKKGLPVLVANDAHYPAPEDYHKHEMLMAMQYHKRFDEEHFEHPQSLYIMGEDEVRAQLNYLPERVVAEAIANTDELMEKCTASLPAKKLHLPKVGRDADETKELLKDLALDGLRERYGDGQADDRLIYEYNEICKAGLQDYFLIVWNFIKWARKQGIMVGPGRGSAGGSLLAYCLGITNVDPIRYGLVFERFWNPGRSQGLPDIDVDFPVDRRAEVKSYLARLYGEDNVLQIGNHIRMRPKSALDKVAAAFYEKPPYQDLTLIKRIIDKTTDAGLQSDWDDIEEQVGQELEQYEDKYPELFEFAKALTGRISTYGVHASAVVVSDVPLPEELPAMLRTAADSDGSKGDKVLATQLEMHGVEEMGFPKFDLLGLRNLDTLQLTVDLAEASFDFRAQNYNTMPKSYWEQIDKGQTLGLFQIEEGHAARRIGRKLQPRGVEDLAAIVALNRPGPLRSGMVDHYLARRAGEEDITYPHEILRDILEPTYGDFLYQEQVLAYFGAIGYSLSEADDIRKMLGKKLVDKMREEYPRYLERASQHMPAATAEAIWDDILGFSKYGFNKCASAKTFVHLPDGTQMHISKAFKLQVPEVMSMWADGTIRPHKVSAITKSGMKPLVKVTTKNGLVFRGTKDHRLLSMKGYLPIEDLRVGDELLMAGIRSSPFSGTTDAQRTARQANAASAARHPNGRAAASKRLKERRAAQSPEELVEMARRMRETAEERYPGHQERARAKAHARMKWLRANDPAWVKQHTEHSLASVRAIYDTGPGYGRCSIASNGMWCASQPERDMCEWLIEQDIEFEMHKVLPGGRICDFYFAGIYWEMDGMDRTIAYFEEKYSDDLPFVVVTPEDYKMLVEHHLGLQHVENGDPIVSIESDGTGMTYDIEMQPDGPLNWIAGRFVSHNSHAVAYGMILAWTMYAKWKWPTEFILASIISNSKKVGEYIAEGRRLGVTVKPPDINVSAEKISKVGDAIYFGLSDIKGVGGAAARWVVDHRPYRSFEHFETVLYLAQDNWDSDEDRVGRGRSPKQTVPKHVVGALYNAGAFDGFDDGRLDSEMSMEALAEYEEALLGIALTDIYSDVIEANRSDIDALDSITEALREDGYVCVPGVVTEVKTTRTREDAWQGGRDMAKVKIMWDGEEVEFAAFPDAWDTFRYMLKPRVVGKFDLRLSIKGASLQRGFRYL